MKLFLGVILSLVGGAIIVWGIGHALLEISNLYSGATSNPLGQADNAEMQMSHRIMHDAKIGAIGIPFLLAGGVFLRLARRRKRYRN